jgi:hypothetical protein
LFVVSTLAAGGDDASASVTTGAALLRVDQVGLHKLNPVYP